MPDLLSELTLVFLKEIREGERLQSKHSGTETVS